MVTTKNAATPAAKTDKETPAQTPAKVVPVQIETKKEASTLPPLEDRILRINQLFELQSRYNRLQKSENKLAEFKMKKGEENITLSISDRNAREEFSTQNPELIIAVLECVRVSIQQRKKALEPSLKW